MSFLVAIEGTVVSSTVNKFGPGGGPANVAHFPKVGAPVKGSYIYVPATTPTPAMFAKIHVDYGSFSVTRPPGVGTVALFNSNNGIRYADGDSLGFQNVSLPAAGWELEEFTLWFTNPPNPSVTLDPAKLDFNLFTERAISVGGTSGISGPLSVVLNLLVRIDVAIMLPT